MRSDLDRLLMGLLLGTIMSGLALMAEPAAADLDFCTALLIHAEDETPAVVEATLLHTLALDHSVLFDPAANMAMFYGVGPNLNMGEYALLNFTKFAQGLRAGGEAARPKIDAALELMWRNLRAYYSPESRYLKHQDNARDWYTCVHANRKKIPPTELAKIGGILNTIDASPKLKAPMMAILEAYLLKMDGWAGEFSKKRFSRDFDYKDRKSITEKFVGDRGRVAVPNVLPNGGLLVEAIAPLDLKALNAGLEIEPNAADLLTHEGVIHFDAEIQKHIYTLGDAAITARDHFTELLSWAYLYDAAAKWIIPGAKAGKAEKGTFLENLTRMRNHLDSHRRVILTFDHAAMLAEGHIQARIHELRIAPPPTFRNAYEESAAESMIRQRTKTLGRLEANLTEVRGMRDSMEKWGERITNTGVLFQSLRDYAAAGTSAVKDPEELAQTMRNIRATLGLDENLVERLKVKRSWF